MVKLETSMGDIVLELDADSAPKTVANFLEYVNNGHYDGTIFHRVIDGFMIQGGGMTADMKEKSTGQSIENEADNGLKNDAYTVAMARTMDPHSATAGAMPYSARSAKVRALSTKSRVWIPAEAACTMMCRKSPSKLLRLKLLMTNRAAVILSIGLIEGG